jgi:endonuclease/exonuclease/phosphatase family metal-dependent hydrolase
MEEQTAHPIPEPAPIPAATTRPKRSFWGKVLRWTNWIAILFLLFSYLAPFISPRVFWPVAFFGISYPVLFALNLLFVIYWLIRWRMFFLNSFFAIALGFPILSGYMTFNSSHIPEAALHATHKIKFMSFNTKLFDLYNWSHNMETRNKIFGLFKTESPDIICMQEFYNQDKGPFRNLDTLCRLLKAKHTHSEYTVNLRGNDHWGMATFSSYPIVNKGHIDFNVAGNNSCIFTDIDIDGDTIRVYNMHLQSMHFSNSDYKYMADLLEVKDVHELEGSRTILRRLKWAFRRRAGQADIIADHIHTCRYPVIICGDFNDTPASYTYHTLSRGLTDAFRESGNGFGRTYFGKFPSFRIDYILHSPRLLSWGYQTIITDLSDHYPITCFFSVKKQ